jgi:quercetin dioxygenase-like cupin family protein
MKTDAASWIVEKARPEADLDVFGVRVNILASSGETHGSCSVARIIANPGAGAPLHRHVEVERFHVLRGCLTVEADGLKAMLHQGDAVTVAPWVSHRFSNESAEEVEFIAIGTPGGHDGFFRDADELSRSGRFTPEAAARLCAEHGIELVH